MDQKKKYDQFIEKLQKRFGRHFHSIINLNKSSAPLMMLFQKILTFMSGHVLNNILWKSRHSVAQLVEKIWDFGASSINRM